jgi:hypothetical protein
MHLVLTLLVRDEEDILRANLEYHLSQGVDFVLATDNGSVDQTVEILEEYEKLGVLRLIHEPSDDYSQARWVTRMARLAFVEHDADWIINSDADEFWWSETGTLKSHLEAIPESVDAVVVPRSNFIPRPLGEDEFFQRMVIRETHSLNSLGDPLPPKVCHRAFPDVEVAQGNHSISLEKDLHVADEQRLLIFHFPLRTYSQFERKIRSGGAAYERNRELPYEYGITWRRLYRELLAGRLRSHFDSQVLSEATIRDGIEAGRLLVDRRLEDQLLKLRPRVASET